MPSKWFYFQGNKEPLLLCDWKTLGNFAEALVVLWVYTPILLIPFFSSGSSFHNFTAAAEGLLSQPFTSFALVLLDLQHIEEIWTAQLKNAN